MFEDKILIKNLRECKNYSSRRLIKEFPNKNWKEKKLDDFLRKLRTVTTVHLNALREVVGQNRRELKIISPLSMNWFRARKTSLKRIGLVKQLSICLAMHHTS